MNVLADLRNAISRTLAIEVKAYDLTRICVRFGLDDGNDDEAWGSKIKYVEQRLEQKSVNELLTIADAVLVEYEGFKLHAFDLKEAIRFARCDGKRKITEITRRNLLDELILMGSLWGKLEVDQFLSRLWPIEAMASQDPRHKTFGSELWRHMVANDDWSTPYLLDRLSAMQLSDEAFIELVDPSVA